MQYLSPHSVHRNNEEERDRGKKGRNMKLICPSLILIYINGFRASWSPSASVWSNVDNNNNAFARKDLARTHMEI